MKKLFLLVIALFMSFSTPAFVSTDERDLFLQIQDFALIRSIGPSIDKAINDYYAIPENRDPAWVGLGEEPKWAAFFGTKLKGIAQVDGAGGIYDIEVLVTTYVGPLPVAEFEITVRVGPEPQKVMDVKLVRKIPLDLLRDVKEEKRNLALIISMAPAIQKALNDYYKVPEHLNPVWEGSPEWAPFFETEITSIVETEGFGGGVSYDLTVSLQTFFAAHVPASEFEMKIRLSRNAPHYQELLSVKHIKDFPIPDYLLPKN